MNTGKWSNLLAILVGLGYSWGGLFPYSIPFLVKFPDYLCTSSEWTEPFKCDWEFIC